MTNYKDDLKYLAIFFIVVLIIFAIEHPIVIKYIINFLEEIIQDD